MPVGAIAGAAVGSAAVQSRSASKAAKAQERATREGISAQEAALERQLEVTEPFRDVGLQAADPLLQQLGIGPGGVPQQDIQLPGAEIFQNPLFAATQQNITKRLLSNQALRGALGSGGTAQVVTQALAPQALSFGLSLQSAREAQKQQRIQNLFNLLGLGSNVSAGQGTAIQQTGQGVAGALSQAGSAQAAGQLGRGQAIGGGIADLAGLGVLSQGGFFGGGGGGQPQFLGGGLPFQAAAVGNIA